MDEFDIRRSAKTLIVEYGTDALAHAAARRDAMKERGDLLGVQIWIRVIRVIEKLQSTEGGPVH